MKRFFSLLIASLFLCTGFGDLSNSEARTPEKYRDLADKYNSLGRRAAPRDAFPVLNFPDMNSAEEGDEVLRPDQWVIGISHNGESKAYPVSVMGIHELGNDEIGGLPITVCW